MARGQTLSILGLYNYDNSIFNNLVLPKELNKTTLINNIMLECAELELVYTDFDMMKFAIGEWSKMRLEAWNRIAEVLDEEYDPFINIKRDEVREITQTRDLQNTLSTNINTETSLSGEGTSNDTTITTNNETTETTNDVKNVNSVNAWDDNSANGVQRDTTITDNDTEVIVNGNTSTTDNLATSNSETGTSETSKEDRGTDTGTIVTRETFHVEGDSAITDAQDVLRKEVEARLEYNIYRYIVNEFRYRFCLLVY